MLLPEYLVNNCFIIPNSTRDNNTMQNRICLLVSSAGFWNKVKHRKNERKYIACPVNSTGEVNSPKDYSPVNSALHNLPVNRISMNIYF